MNQDPLLRRIRESILRLSHTPERTTYVVDEAEAKARESVRQLARSRVSELLRQLRAVHGLSYAEIQQRTGLSQQMLFDVEYKDRRLTLEQLRLLAQLYQISPGDILGIDLE